MRLVMGVRLVDAPCLLPAHRSHHLFCDAHSLYDARWLICGRRNDSVWDGGAQGGGVVVFCAAFVDGICMPKVADGGAPTAY